MRQIALPFDELSPGKASDSLLVTPSNAHVFSMLAQGADWPGHCAILLGPPRSGKTIMARYFAAQGGEIVDDAKGFGWEALFHKWNAAQSAGVRLLLTADQPLSAWNVDLPDLRSRLGASMLLEINPPDDELAEQLLLKFFKDRGTSIGVETLAYVIRRIERSHAALEDFARRANAEALAEGAAITLPFARRMIEGDAQPEMEW